MYILKIIRYNWLNQKDFDKEFHFPNLFNFKVDYCDYPLKFGCASFQDVGQLYNSERTSLAMLASNLTIKSVFPSSIERQNVKLVLKAVNKLTISALTI